MLVIGFLAQIAAAWAIGIIALVVGLLLILSARSATRWAAPALLVTMHGKRYGNWGWPGETRSIPI